MTETKMILCGACGRMGINIAEFVKDDPGVKIVAGVDVSQSYAGCSFPIYGSISDVKESADVIVDFSHHSVLSGILEYAVKNHVPAVIATTGHNDAEMELMRGAAKTVPVFFSRNMSVGITLLIELAKKSAAALGSKFDIEIVEEHHNKKLDAPSGTALMIADAINDSQNGRFSYTFDRHSERRERDSDEIGIHSVRGGSIVGEHQVIFAGNSEVVRLSHSAGSRMVFAEGAIRAAKFLPGKAPGLYSMTDIVKEVI